MDLSASAQFWVNLLLLWIGFGTVVGLVAKLLLPGNEPKSAFGVLVLGVMGSCIGPMLVTLIFKPEGFNPIGPLGLFVSVLAASILLILYRLVRTFVKRPGDE